MSMIVRAGRVLRVDPHRRVRAIASAALLLGLALSAAGAITMLASPWGVPIAAFFAVALGALALVLGTTVLVAYRSMRPLIVDVEQRRITLGERTIPFERLGPWAIWRTTFLGGEDGTEHEGWATGIVVADERASTRADAPAPTPREAPYRDADAERSEVAIDGVHTEMLVVRMDVCDIDDLRLAASEIAGLWGSHVINLPRTRLQQVPDLSGTRIVLPPRER